MRHSKFWFWPFLAGGFFGLGYSITKNIYISKIYPESAKQENFNQSWKENDSLDIQNKKESTLSSKRLNKSIQSKKKFQNIINIPTSDNSYRRISINYSTQIDSIKKEVFKNNLNFFQKENVETLMKTLKNTKKTKSSKIKFD